MSDEAVDLSGPKDSVIAYVLGSLALLLFFAAFALVVFRAPEVAWQKEQGGHELPLLTVRVIELSTWLRGNMAFMTLGAMLAVAPVAWLCTAQGHTRAGQLALGALVLLAAAALAVVWMALAV